MASTAPTPNPSGAPSANVDELRGVLASKGLVVKDSILARLAKSKSFKETLTLAQDAERQLESSAQSTENGVQTENEESECEALTTQKPKQVEDSKEAADNTADISNSSGFLRKNTKEDILPLLETSEGGRVSALGDALLNSSSEEERKQRRTERFGTVSDDEKIKQRAARFGIMQDVNEEAEKKRARAARFGIVDEDAKKKARLERFKVSEPEDKDETEKRKARALRFAPSTEPSIVSLSETKENGSLE